MTRKIEQREKERREVQKEDREKRKRRRTINNTIDNVILDHLIEKIRICRQVDEGGEYCTKDDLSMVRGRREIVSWKWKRRRKRRRREGRRGEEREIYRITITKAPREQTNNFCLFQDGLCFWFRREESNALSSDLLDLESEGGQEGGG